jgi:hypothetical protein
VPLKEEIMMTPRDFLSILFAWTGAVILSLWIIRVQTPRIPGSLFDQPEMPRPSILAMLRNIPRWIRARRRPRGTTPDDPHVERILSRLRIGDTVAIFTNGRWGFGDVLEVFDRTLVITSNRFVETDTPVEVSFGDDVIVGITTHSSDQRGEYRFTARFNHSLRVMRKRVDHDRAA